MQALNGEEMTGRRGSGAGSTGGGERSPGVPWFLQAGAPEPPWRELFAGNSTRQILERLYARDALQLAEYCEHRLIETALLIHPDRLLARAAARVAYGAAFGYYGDPPLAAWLCDRIDDSIEELLAEDIEDERGGVPPEGPNQHRYTRLIPREVGIAPEQCRLTCVVFNTLPESMRRPFFRVFLEGVSIERYAMEHDRPLDEVVAQIEETTRRLVLLVENGEHGDNGKHGEAGECGEGGRW